MTSSSSRTPRHCPAEPGAMACTATRTSGPFLMSSRPRVASVKVTENLIAPRRGGAGRSADVSGAEGLALDWTGICPEAPCGTGLGESSSFAYEGGRGRCPMLLSDWVGTTGQEDSSRSGFFSSSSASSVSTSSSGLAASGTSACSASKGGGGLSMIAPCSASLFSSCIDAARGDSAPSVAEGESKRWDPRRIAATISSEITR
mmetsp:Transcript_6415/g.18800  ORF Transcript_6415/g.18800 Transcript_6415/m.18800 type:complete len:203 (-) Transcript_6415:1340-1948(-)